MFEIIEVHKCALPLLCLKPLLKLFRKVEKHQNPVPRFLHIAPHLRRHRKATELFHFCDCLFDPIPASGHIGFQVRINFLAPHGCKAIPADFIEHLIEFLKILS